MADFISALTGVQMDSALLDMAEHNSEAYAVGERNGIAVASDDVTYHNNARYYAQIASSQIVGDASSAVRWDTDQSEALTDAQKAQARENINAASDSDVVKITAQTLTTAQQAQARANIAAGGSNPNLLDNPWFTVNQRGYTNEAVSYGFAADRWFFYNAPSNMTVTWTENGMAFAKVDESAAGNGRLRTHLPIEPFLRALGQPFTYSIKADGVVYSATFNNLSTAPTGSELLLSTTITTDSGDIELVVQYQVANNRLIAIFRPRATMVINAVKLELGSVSTLANDAPPDYGEELAKCQRYCRVLSTTNGGYVALGYAMSATNFRLQFPFAMRTAPTVSFSGTINLNGANTVTAISSTGSFSDFVSLNITSSGLTTGSTYLLNITTGATITLSADL